MGVPMRAAAIGWGLVLGLLAGIARAEVVVVVSAENPIAILSRTDLADIYLGRMIRFPNGDRIVPIDQKNTSPAYKEFYTGYLGRSPAQITAHWSKLIFTGRGQPPQAAPGDGATAEIVAGNPHAIGYVDRRLVDDRLRVVQIE